MATPAQRIQAIADAVLNATATPAQINRFGTALAYTRGYSTQYAALNQSDKALWVVTEIKRDMVNAVRTMDRNAAGDAVDAAVSQEFP